MSLPCVPSAVPSAALPRALGGHCNPHGTDRTRCLRVDLTSQAAHGSYKVQVRRPKFCRSQEAYTPSRVSVWALVGGFLGHWPARLPSLRETSFLLPELLRLGRTGQGLAGCGASPTPPRLLQSLSEAQPAHFRGCGPATPAPPSLLQELKSTGAENQTGHLGIWRGKTPAAAA